MEDSAKRIRAAVRRHRGGRSGRGLRYPGWLRAEATLYAREQLEKGERLRRISDAVDIGLPTLQRWLDSEPEAALRLVELVPDATALRGDFTHTVVTPSGYRVEGLSLDQVSRLLRELS